MSALLLLNPAATDSNLLSDSLIAATLACLNFKSEVTRILAACALVHGCSPRVYAAISAEVQGLRSSDIEPPGISNLCFAACCVLRDVSLAGQVELARRLEGKLCLLLRDHSVDESAVSAFASVMLTQRRAEDPAAACLDVLAKLFDPRKGLFGAAFSRRSQKHQCAVLHHLLAHVMSHLGALPQTNPPRYLAPQHAALLCGVIARGVSLAAEKCSGRGCNYTVAKVYAEAADAALCAAKSCTSFIDHAIFVHLDALLPPSDAASPSSAFLLGTKSANDAVMKMREGLQNFLRVCESRGCIVVDDSVPKDAPFHQRLRSCLVAIPRVIAVFATDSTPASREMQLSQVHTALLFSVIYMGLSQAEYSALAFNALESVLKSTHILNPGALAQALLSAVTDTTLQVMARFSTAEPPWVSTVSLAAYCLSLEPDHTDAVANWCAAEAMVTASWKNVGVKIRHLRESLGGRQSNLGPMALGALSALPLAHGAATLTQSS